jgi:NADH:ubiquinone oxidoreductase subunit D
MLRYQNRRTARISIADVVALIGTIDIVLGSVDR